MMNPEEPAVAIPPPTSVDWELTYACQLRCSHCYTESGRVPSRKLPREKLVRIAEVLGGMGLASVYLVGGEPLLVPEVFELGDILRASGTHVVLYTNGVGISRALAARIAATFPRVHVSLDGMSAAVHDAIRGRQGAFADAERTLAHFDELAAPPTVNGFGFGVDVVVVRRNYEQIETFCRELPRRYPHIRSLLLGAAIPLGLAGSEVYVEKELLTEEQLAELDDAGVQRRLRSLVPSSVRFEVCSNKRWRRPELMGSVDVEADGSVRPWYLGTALGDMLVDEPWDLFRRALGRATDPFVRERMSGVETTADWARALREIRAHFAPAQPLRARPARR
ncbi:MULTISPECIES: radical SAM protein [Sorangium]|uniref:Radical SAM protein n=1 Tax=Sorangium cellulosum TaxID=56 RepID=A0A4V0NGT4_SORCE|nr:MULTISPECIES: radical SAM protein [Sorangium]AUX34282.1 radical SAM protein [Sorangium cellulosum]WCQ93600.1 GTP 3',8-cyclase [Sorangium sp. Soce836]